jgi:hypothetical protein
MCIKGISKWYITYLIQIWKFYLKYFSVWHKDEKGSSCLRISDWDPHVHSLEIKLRCCWQVSKHEWTRIEKLKFLLQMWGWGGIGFNSRPRGHPYWSRCSLSTECDNSDAFGKISPLTFANGASDVSCVGGRGFPRIPHQNLVPPENKARAFLLQLPAGCLIIHYHSLIWHHKTDVVEKASLNELRNKPIQSDSGMDQVS